MVDEMASRVVTNSVSELETAEMRTRLFRMEEEMLEQRLGAEKKIAELEGELAGSISAKDVGYAPKP